MNKEQLIFLGGSIALGLAAKDLLRGAFTADVRKKMWERSGGVSEKSGRGDMPMQCSHFWHHRHIPSPHNGAYYNDLENGWLVSIEEHLEEHLEASFSSPKWYGSGKHRAHLLPNGLSVVHNNFAIESLSAQVDKWYLREEFANHVFKQEDVNART